MLRKNLFIAVVILVAIFSNTYSQTEADKTKIDNFIQTVQKKLNLQTGLSIGIVADGKVFFQKGYGYSDISNNIKADENTPFYIASSTKSFTASLAKILNEEDTLDIDKPISEYLPEFQFETEPLNVETISIRDLLTHRHGIFSIPAVIRTAYTGQHTKEKLFEIYKMPRYSGIEFKYSNDGYVLTSLIIDEVMKKSWQDLMKEKLFLPLEMNNTSCRISDYDKNDLPKAYATKSGDVNELVFLKADNTMHAAGGIISTASDLCNWLLFNLSDGTFKEERILSEKSMSEIHSPQIRLSKSFWEYYRYAYGLGWYISDYNDETLIHHFGGYSGARSHISFIPEKGIGVVALTNDDGEGFFVVDLVADYVYNLLTGKDADAIAEKELVNILEQVEKNRGEKKEESETASVQSSYDYSLLVGDYKNNMMGEIKISNEDKLLFEFGNLTGELIPTSDTKFSTDVSAFTFGIEFQKEEDRIKQLILKGPATLTFEKVK